MAAMQLRQLALGCREEPCGRLSTRQTAFTAATAKPPRGRAACLVRTEQKMCHVPADAGKPCTSGSWQRLGSLSAASWAEVGQALLLAELTSASASSRMEDQKQDAQHDQLEYYVSFGAAIRKLREDIPRFFQRDPSMDIFSDDVALVDAISQYLGWGEQKTVHGKDSYRRHMWSLRFHAALLFRNSQVDVLRLWQRDSHTVAVRWTLRCAPRVVSSRVVSLDGISEYKFNSKGKIYHHKIDVVDLSSSPRLLQRAESFVGAGIAL